eukprot:5588987-Prymnesium_polylepis.1
MLPAAALGLSSACASAKIAEPIGAVRITVGVLGVDVPSEWSTGSRSSGVDQSQSDSSASIAAAAPPASSGLA